MSNREPHSQSIPKPCDTPISGLSELEKGDSIQEISDYWGDATIEEIHDRVIEWKTRQQ